MHHFGKAGRYGHMGRTGGGKREMQKSRPHPRGTTSLGTPFHFSQGCPDGANGDEGRRRVHLGTHGW